jgi:hypothetical protein
MGCGILRRQARPYSSVDEGCNQGRNGWVAQWNKPLEHWNIGTLEGDFIGGSAEGVGAGPLLPVAGANHVTRQWWRMLRELEKVAIWQRPRRALSGPWTTPLAFRPSSRKPVEHASYCKPNPTRLCQARQGGHAAD